MREEWRQIAESPPGYRVSNKGRVKRPNGAFSAITYTIEGYCKVRVGLLTRRTIHRLVALAFIGPDPTVEGGPRYVVDHIDDNPYNNKVTNLQWITNSENLKKGFRQRGKRAKMSPERTAAFHSRVMDGVTTNADICAEFRMSPPNVRRVRKSYAD